MAQRRKKDSVLIVGNPLVGFAYYGPDTREELVAATIDLDDEWWIVTPLPVRAINDAWKGR